MVQIGERKRCREHFTTTCVDLVDVAVGIEKKTVSLFRPAPQPQPSRGIIVSTGLGSSAWIRSSITGSLAIAGSCGSEVGDAYQAWARDERILQFAVREPFPSRTSQTSMVFGRVGENEKLILRSLMPENGVKFSGGIEADFHGFSSGMVASIGVAEQSGRLVV